MPPLVLLDQPCVCHSPGRGCNILCIMRLSLAWQRLQTIDRTRLTLSRHESELARREVRADLKAVASAASAAAWMAACRCIELVIRRPAAARSSSATPPALASRSRCVCHRESGIVSRSSWLVDASDESASILSRVQMQTSSSAGRPKSDGEGGGGKGAGGGVEGEAVQASGAGRLCEAPMWTLSAIAAAAPRCSGCLVEESQNARPPNEAHVV